MSSPFSSVSTSSPQSSGHARRLTFNVILLVYLGIAALCTLTLALAGDLSWGRNPWQNLLDAAADFSRPSFLDIWFGPDRLEFRGDDGTVLRVENRREVEWSFVGALMRATWTTFQIATLGSLLAAVIAVPFGLITARNMQITRWMRLPASLVLNTSRSIHTLVFGLILVGVVGLGPTAGILAIAMHSMGTYGKLYAENIEALDMDAIDAVRSTGATPLQVFFTAVWPAVLPQLASSHLYIWEFNIRDSTILGLIGAGGLGLLISEAASLFQWGRLATILLVITIMVTGFDALSRRVRMTLQ